MITGYNTSTGVDIGTLFESGTSATPTGYLLSAGGGGFEHNICKWKFHNKNWLFIEFWE